MGLNTLITLHCASVIPKVCDAESVQDNGDGQLMDCLISKKNVQAMRETPKCRAVVESFQVLAMKEISFTPRFKKECQNDVPKYCKQVKNKRDVIECLSKKIRSDILNDDKPQVSRGCRQQLRLQISQRHENVDKFDPVLKERCQNDIREICQDVTKGQGQILECLKANHRHLSHSCHLVVFKREEEMMRDPSTDVVLTTGCRNMIKLFCHDTNNNDILNCLKLHRNDLKFDLKCHSIVSRRMIEQSTDTRLNPELRKACRPDMGKFCKNIYHNTRNDEDKVELNGKLTECLKRKLPERKLTNRCAAQIILLTRNAALDFNMDPMLKENCENDMKVA